MDARSFFLLGVHLLQGFILKENWVGKSFLSPKAENAMKKELGIDSSEKYRLVLDCPLEGELMQILQVHSEEFN